jgi:hypothetical protein|eukprot:COSAG06_NODE_208_length_20182_cov_31.214759_22_plen_179_part_00
MCTLGISICVLLGTPFGAQIRTTTLLSKEGWTAWCARLVIGERCCCLSRCRRFVSQLQHQHRHQHRHQHQYQHQHRRELRLQLRLRLQLQFQLWLWRRSKFRRRRSLQSSTSRRACSLHQRQWWCGKQLHQWRHPDLHPLVAFLRWCRLCERSGAKSSSFEQFTLKTERFTKTGSGQT